MGQGWSLQEMVLGKLDIHMQKNEIGPLSYTTHKNYLTTDFRKTLRHETS